MGFLQFAFNSEQRLKHKSQFELVYEEGKRVSAGPLLIYSMQNSLGHARLGLSVPKRVGHAVKRNAVKRRCREAFRLDEQYKNAGLDIVINVRPHEILDVQTYLEHLRAGTAS